MLGLSIIRTKRLRQLESLDDLVADSYSEPIPADDPYTTWPSFADPYTPPDVPARCAQCTARDAALTPAEADRARPPACLACQDADNAVTLARYMGVSTGTVRALVSATAARTGRTPQAELAGMVARNCQ